MTFSKIFLNQDLFYLSYQKFLVTFNETLTSFIVTY